MELLRRHLLIISCSKTKSSLLKENRDARLPALKGYNGKIFLTLRKALREGLGQNVDVLIISAKYGLLEATDEISYYEERMTKKKAHELRDSVLSRLISHINGHSYKKVFIMLGRDYYEAIRGIREISKIIDVPIEFIKMEKIGKAQQKLRNLLFKISPQIAIS